MQIDPVTGGQVLVAVDGSPASLEALRVGRRMATLMGHRLVAVTAWEQYRYRILPRNWVHPEKSAQQLVTNSVLAAFRGEPAPQLDVVVVEGDPADQLVELSRDAALLVMGNRGHTGLAGVLLGSVSTNCAARAHCAVLVVRAAGHLFTTPGAATSGAVGHPRPVPAT